METTNTIKNFAKRTVMTIAVMLMAGNVWGAPTNVSITMGSSTGYWNIQATSSSFTDTYGQVWSSSANTSNGANGNQVGSKNNTCTSLILSTTANQTFQLESLTLNTAGSGNGASGSWAFTINGVSVSSGATISGSTATTVTLSSSTKVLKGQEITLAYTGTAKGVKATSLTYSYSAAPASCDYKVTVTKSATTNGSFTVHEGTATGTEVAHNGTVDNCGSGTTTLVVVPNPTSDDYYCSAVSASNSANVEEDEDGNWVITYSQGSSKSSNISATFSSVPSYDVTWTANGAEHAKTSVKKGQKPTFPSTPISTDYKSKQFVGWATTTWDTPLDDVSSKTIYTYGDAMPTVNGDVEYFAVWAKSTDTYSILEYGDALTDGNYVFAAYASSNDYAMGNTISSYMIAGSYISVDSNNEIEEPDAQFIWKLSHIDGTYVSLYNAAATTNHYLGLTSSGLTLEANPNTNGQFNPVLSNTSNLATIALKSKSQSGKEIQYYSGNFKSYTSQSSNIYAYKEILEKYITTCASCNTNPTLGTPTLTSLISGKITVQCPSISAGNACEITDYGFVWEEDSDPTISDNKSQVGTDDHSTAYSKELSISWTTGTTYHIKAYASNAHGTTLSSTLEVTPQSVTFMNGADVYSVVYVNNGATVSTPASDPSKEGYTFAAWKKGSSVYDFDATVAENTILDASYNANTYKVRFNANGGTGSMKDQDFTYDYKDTALTANAFVAPAGSHTYFNGWATTQEKANAGTVDYEDEKEVRNLTTTQNGIYNLYAVWVPYTYTNYRTRCCVDPGKPSSLALVEATSSTLQVNWSELEHASQYIATLYTDAACTEKALATTNPLTVNTNSATFEGLNELSSYYFTVQSKGTGTYCVDGSVSDPSGELQTLSSKTLSSISIATPASKTNYVAGETLDLTGLVVHANYTSGDPDVVTGGCSFSPSTSDELTTSNDKVTISYGTVEDITYDIHVYAVTPYVKDEDQATLSGEGKPTISIDAMAVTTASAGDYVFKEWQVENATLTDKTETSATITNPTGAVTVTAVYYKPALVKWSVNGNDEYAQTTVAHGSSVTSLPEAPASSACDDAKKFVGWRAQPLSSMSETKPSGIFTKVADAPAVENAETTFYAVFADVTGGDAIELTFPDDNSDYNSVQDYTSTWTAKAGTYNFTITNFNNSNWGYGWNHIRCGRKSYTSVASISTADAVPFAVDSVLIEIEDIDESFINSAKLYISANSDFSSVTDMDIPQSEATQKMVIASAAKNKYYKIEFDCKAKSNGFVQINSVVYKQKIDTSNYVTTCASCDADATFTTALPAVSAEDCTSATVTATGGMATLGSEGCNISDYGFVYSLATDPEIDGDGVTKLQVGTSNPTTGEDFSHNITGLTAATHYYVRAYAINRHGTAYSSTKDFWTNGVSSIAVTHAPSKTNYIVGETFDATGMEVTATLAGGATDDVTADVTYSSSALTVGVDQDFTISYTLCETEKTANQTINVYTLSVNEGTNADKGVASYTTGATFSVGSLAEHTTFNFDVTNGFVTQNGDGSFTATPNGNGNVTVTVNYVTAVPVDVKYYVNGNELTGLAKNPYQSEEFDMPNASAVASAMTAASISVGDVNFVGWSTTDFPYQTTEPTLVGASVSVMEATNYYAVFTNVNVDKIRATDFNGGGYLTTKITINGNDYTVNNVMNTSGIQFKKNSGYFYATDELKNIVKVVIVGDALVVNACSDESGTIDGSAITPSGAGTTISPYIYTFPSNMQYIKIAGRSGETDHATIIDIYYAPEAVYYTTQFQTLTFNKADGNKDKDEIVATDKVYTLTADDAPTAVEHYTFLDKWTDSQNTYEIGDAVTMSTNVTLTPISAYETTGDTDIDGLPESVTEIVVNVSKELNVNDDRTINTLTIKSSSGAFEVDGTSGQVTGGNTLTVTDNLFLEIKLCDGPMNAEASRKWYCIAAPFDVAINGGFFWGDGTPMVLNTHFQLFEWDGDRRATGASGWRRTSSNMKAGVAYFIGFDDERENQNTIKLKAMNNTISNRAKIVAPTHSGSAEAATYGNWNGLANPNFHHIALNKNVQAFDYNKQGYSPYATGEYNFVVGTPFFIQYAGDITIEAATNANYRAPKREDDIYSYSVRIGSADANHADNRIVVRASETASAEFDNEHDMITLNGTTSNYGALLWTENYGGKRLAIEEAPLVNGTASYVLTLSAPKAGTYSISVAAPKENADLYLTYEGSIIWNLSEGAYTLDLNKGITNGYGLILRANAPSAATGIDEAESGKQKAESVQKIILDEKVFILRGGKMYDVTGKAVK